MNEVRIEYLRPRQIDVAMSRCPTIFLPIGTIEWHGYHNVTGVDALIAQAMCLRAAERGGGLVHPTHYGAVGGLQEQHTFVFDTERIIDSVFFQPWLEKWCREAVRNGFKSIILLTGHAGAAQQIAVRAAAARMTRILDTPVLGTAAYWLSIDLHINVDHAAFYETSLMIHLYPDTVDLDELGDPPHRGVYGKDPKQFATADAGERCTDASVERLATLATTMPGCLRRAPYRD